MWRALRVWSDNPMGLSGMCRLNSLIVSCHVIVFVFDGVSV